MNIITFTLIEAAIAILPVLWLKTIEHREEEAERKRAKRQQYKEWTAHWIPIQYHTTIKGEWVA